MPLPALVPVISGVASVTKALFGRKASKEKKRAAAARNKIRKIQQFQEKRKFINDFLTAQSTALAQGALSGAGLGSSGVQGQLASQRTQATAGLDELATQSELGQVANIHEGRASKATDAAALAGVVGDIASLPGISDSINKVGTKIGFG